jgi:hypothetical protein
MSVIENDDDKLITVCYKNDTRKKMRMSEAYAAMDMSKNIALCANCQHSIDVHSAVKNFRRDFAGKCSRKNCPCRRYKPGVIVTKKELDQSISPLSNS